uniref:Uncharacterized protein n=1 Tax=Pyxicephalus adspersus TaxID=30357 RepID=A0AAV3A2I7_PYXAD|nr:TPA: hypothetical protein GDO54_016150 [Pyxicephalus adspersus]
MDPASQTPEYSVHTHYLIHLYFSMLSCSPHKSHYPICPIMHIGQRALCLSHMPNCFGCGLVEQRGHHDGQGFFCRNQGEPDHLDI